LQKAGKASPIKSNRQTIKMKNLNNISIISYFVLILTITFAVIIQAQDKKKIYKLDDLPRYTYPIDINASELLVSDKEFNSFAKQVREDIQSTLDEYDIEDKTTLKE